MVKRINWNFLVSSFINFIVFGGMLRFFQNNIVTIEFALSVVLGMILLKLSLAFLLDFFYGDGYVQDEVFSHFVEIFLMLIL